MPTHLEQQTKPKKNKQNETEQKHNTNETTPRKKKNQIQINYKHILNLNTFWAEFYLGTSHFSGIRRSRI